MILRNDFRIPTPPQKSFPKVGVMKLSYISLSVPPGSAFSQVAFGIVPLLPKQGINRMIGIAGGAPLSADFSATRWVSSLGSQGSPENKLDRVVGSVVSNHV